MNFSVLITNKIINIYYSYDDFSIYSFIMLTPLLVFIIHNVEMNIITIYYGVISIPIIHNIFKI